MVRRERVLPAGLAVVVLLLIAGCARTSGAGSSPTGTDGRVSVVASTDVWGSVAAAVGAGRVRVTSLIDDPARDPHEFQADVRDRLAVTRAAVVIENGGGYDDFMIRLVGPRPQAAVLNAVELSGRRIGSTGNEHVWYDLPTVAAVARAVERALVRVDPPNRAAYAAALARFELRVAALTRQEAAVRETGAGRGVAITEPVPLYLTAACGLVNRTPAAFSTAIEDGRDVPPAALEAQLGLIRARKVALLALNEQAEEPTTDQVVAAARSAGVPVVGFRETLPTGTDLLGMIHGELDDVAKAVRA